MPPAPADAAGTPTPADAGTTPATVDAGGGVRAVVRLAPTTLLTDADLTAAAVLAADGDGIYWVNRSNQLWMLPTGSDTPRELAADPNLPGLGFTPAVLVAAGNDLFWTADVTVPTGPNPRPLHRTPKTGGDVVLFTDFPCLPGQVAADDAYLYYSAYPWTSPSGAQVVALPLDADPGTAPSTLAQLTDPDNDVSSLAVDDQRLYWTSWPVSTKTEFGRGRLFIADKASLLSGTANDPQVFVGDFLIVQPSGGSVYFIGSLGQDSSEAGRFDGNGGEVSLPLPEGMDLLILDGWALTFVHADRPAPGQIYAADADAMAGHPNVLVEIADQVTVAPVIGPPGLVFVDGSGRLLAVSTQDLHAAWQAGQQP